MPSVSLDKATLYLLFKMRWSQTRLTNLKKERGYLMFQSKHIHEVCLKEMKHGFIYIKAKCTRQTAQSEAPYVVWMLATGEGNIECAGCQCIGWVKCSALFKYILVYRLYKSCNISVFLSMNLKRPGMQCFWPAHNGLMELSLSSLHLMFQGWRGLQARRGNASLHCWLCST